MVGYLVLVPAQAGAAPAGGTAPTGFPVASIGTPSSASAPVSTPTPTPTPVPAIATGSSVPGPSAPGPLGTGPLGAGSFGAGAPVRPVRPAGRGIAVDVERRNAYVDGRLLDLTYLEFELLAHLTEHPQRVHTRDHLVSAVWGYGHVGDGRTVDVHVARLRRKLGVAYRDSIVTVRRVGYKYTPVA
ncbi:winged helix-turn-helix domain-containing protein [Kitasatospora sp. NPDC058032]|uniref:winged helix-turn-helix domain-containing protein n=1 Tax=Kitasatospora sp. NPDC058032 TaxID=3346307 RepID=UPI0036DC4C89